MALTGEAKKEYQKEYMRDYMRNRRAVKTPSDSVKTLLRPSVKTSDIPLRPDPKAKQETLVELRQLIDATKSKSSPVKAESNSRIPWYNYAIHGPGDRVRMPDGQVVTIPELDADNNPIEVVSTGRLVSDNLFTPSFLPDPKPVKKEKRRRW